MPVRQNLEFVSLVADHQNPRLSRVASGSRAALLSIIRAQRDKIIELAEDIADIGLNPGEALYVMVSPDDPGSYVVLEGNRRFTALKLLQDTSLAEGGHITPTGVKRLHAAAAKFKVPETLECVVFDTREQAAPWLERRHTGQRGGSGLVRWGSVEKARFEFQRTGQKTPGLAVLDYVLENCPTLDAAARLNAEEDFALTNLERVLLDVKAQVRLCVSVEGGRVTSTLYGVRLARLLSKLVTDVATWLKVSHIDDETLRATYLDGMQAYLPEAGTPRTAPRLIADIPADEAEPPTPQPKSTHQPAPSQQDNTPQEPHGGTGAESTGEANGGGEGEGAPAPSPDFNSTTTSSTTSPPSPNTPKLKSGSKERKGAFPRGTKIYIKHRRVNDIFLELKRINLESFPNAAAVLTRVFLELSTDVLLDKEPSARPLDKNPKLYQKLKSAITFLDGQNKLPAKYAEQARAATEDYGDGSTRAMNIAVHNMHAAPSPDDIKNTWDKYEHYVRGLWLLIAERH